MGKSSKGVRDFADAARLEKYNEFRKDVDPGRLGLALQAIRQRVDQDLMIAVAAYEIDCNIDDSNFRIHRRPEDSLPEILAIKARLDVVDTLMEKYEAEYLELHPEIKEQMEAAAAAQAAEEATGPEQDLEFVDPTDAGWGDVDPADSCEAMTEDELSTEFGPTDADPASPEA